MNLSNGILPRIWLWPVILYELCNEVPWWRHVDSGVFIGKVPLRSHVGILESMGIKAVVCMTERWETFVPEDIWRQHGIDILCVPTTDNGPPSIKDLQLISEFIEENVIKSKKVYVHCKHGRGRSAVAVMSWLKVEYRRYKDALRVLYTAHPNTKLSTSQIDCLHEFFSLKIENEVTEIPEVPKEVTEEVTEVPEEIPEESNVSVNLAEVYPVPLNQVENNSGEQ